MKAKPSFRSALVSCAPSAKAAERRGTGTFLLYHHDVSNDRAATATSEGTRRAEQNAIAKALMELEYRQSAAFLRGARHIQMEPIWGGQEDTASTLRGVCMLGLITCSDVRRDIILPHDGLQRAREVLEKTLDGRLALFTKNFRAAVNLKDGQRKRRALRARAICFR